MPMSDMHRVYTLRVSGPANFVTIHSHLGWALKYAERYRREWPSARLSLVSTVEIW